MKKNFIIIGILLLIGGTVLVSKEFEKTKTQKTFVKKTTIINTPQNSYKGKPLNIIVIDICSTRADHFSFNGYSRQTTPNIDNFAKQSAVFDNAWTASGFCLPNFGAMLTGTRPETNKLLIPSKSTLPTSIKTLQEVLHDAGYTTAGFSGSRYLTEKFGLTRGFDTYNNPYVVKTVPMPAVSFEQNREKVFSWINANSGKDPKKNPFFLYVTVDDLHSPYHSPDPNKYNPNYNGILDTIPTDMSKTSDLDVGGGFFARAYNGDTAVSIPQKVKDDVIEFNKDPKNLDHLIARYDAALNYADTLVGELLDKIKSAGLYDNSIIVITGHQGESLGENGLLGHFGGIYETILHVPLIIHMPQMTEGKRLPQLAERIDIPATILDIVGLQSKYKNQFAGNSLFPLINGDKIDWKNYAFASSKPIRDPNDITPAVEEIAVRNDQYKLIWYGYKKDQYELYDLKKDPQEKNNLAASLPKVFNELKKQIDEYKAKNK